MRCSWLSTACELCVGQHRRVGEHLLAAHDRDLRMLREPRRRGGVGRDEDASHPRREQVHRPERVLELVDLPVAGLGIVALADDVALHALRALAHELVARPVDPREHHVDLEVDVARERGEHVLEGRPVAPVQVHRVVDGLRARQGAAHERVLDRGLDGVVAEPPELQLHRGLAAVAEPPDGLDARTVEPQHGGLAVRGEAAVGEQHRHRSGAAVGRDRRGVERLVRERVGEGAGHGLAIGTVDGDDESLVVAAHEQEPDPGRVEGVADREQVLHHRFARRHVAVPQGVLPLAQHEVVAIEPRQAGRGRHQHELRGIREPHRRGRGRLPPRERVPGVVVVVGRSIAVGTRHGRVASRGRVSTVRGCRDCSDSTQRDATLRPDWQPRIAAPDSAGRARRIRSKLDGRTCARRTVRT